jgi:hypothetical protein
VQYDNTIRDLVGIEGNPSEALAPDTTGSVDQRAWDGYKTAADAVSQQIMANPTAKARAIPCTPSGDGAACAQRSSKRSEGAPSAGRSWRKRPRGS